MFLQPDALAVCERHQPVVIHHRVHVLDPHRVDIAIKHDVAHLVLRGWPVDLSEDAGEQPVRPVAGRRVEDAVQLDDTPVLRVDGEQLSSQAQSARKEQWSQCIHLRA